MDKLIKDQIDALLYGGEVKPVTILILITFQIKKERNGCFQ